jgi:hypothetical protein
MLNYILGLVFLALLIYSLYLLIVGGKTKNLNKLIWALLIIFVPYLGIILYWVIERKLFS